MGPGWRGNTSGPDPLQDPNFNRQSSTLFVAALVTVLTTIAPQNNLKKSLTAPAADARVFAIILSSVVVVDTQQAVGAGAMREWELGS